MENRNIKILKENIQSLDKSMTWLKRSYVKSLKIDLKTALSEKEFDIMENLTSRYSRGIDLIISKIFRSIDAVELEDSGTLIDVINRAEKRELIESSERLREFKDLRNEIVHEYETDDLSITFNQVRNNVNEILTIATNIKVYCTRKNYLI
jgi:uncharacterized protein YutE (UPF0331/DUF86 family)